MKKLSVLLSALLITSIVIAQKKPLPACPVLATEINKINSSWDQMVVNAKKITEFPQLTICGIPGSFETVEGYATYNFDFKDEDYAGKKVAFDALFLKILAAVKTTFGSTHEIRNDESKENKSWYITEKGKDETTSRLDIYVRIYYVDWMDEPANSINLEFRSHLKD